MAIAAAELEQNRLRRDLSEEELLDIADDWTTSDMHAHPPGSAEEAAEMQDYERVRDALFRVCHKTSE